MVSKFGIILDILKEAFSTPVSERDYYRIVEVLRNYKLNPCEPTTEQEELVARKWPLHYHPCDHMENIRFGLCFCGEDNIRIQELLLNLTTTHQ